MSITLAPILLRFVLGGGAVVAATVIARSFGGRIGGIFAAFPAVYLAAIISVALEYRGQELLLIAQNLSQGALVGMFTDVICALAASRFVYKYGWKKGLLQAILLWFIIAPAAYYSIHLL